MESSDPTIPKTVEIPDTLTVVEQVTHSSLVRPVQYVVTPFSRTLKTKDQPYRRDNCQATEVAVDVDFGWIESVGMIVIRNEEGRNLMVNPNKEDLEKKILYVYFGDGVEGAWEILPGETFRGSPINPKNLRISSKSGVVKYSIFVVPS